MEGIPMNKIEKLSQIKMIDYESVDIPEWQAVDGSEPVSNDLKEKILSIEKDESLYNFLKNINKKMDEIFLSPHKSPQSLVESRQTKLDECLERGLVSCGIIAKFFTTALRLSGVPVKMIHGEEVDDPDSHTQHGWLEVYSPYSDSWIEIDPGAKDFQVSDRFVKKDIFHHWSEMVDSDR